MNNRLHIKLVGIKVIHTVAWAIFAGCILLLPVVVWHDNFDLAAIFALLVLAEVGILAVNGMRCPLTDVAARYTDDRRDNFDIYLPKTLARHNKMLFGSLYVVGLRGCGFFRVRKGHIVFQRGYWDKLSFLRMHGLPLPTE